MKAVQIRITGKVQGVGYRAWTVAQAQRLSLNGWVRNRRDGSVEAVISGPTINVDEMINLCHQGPQAAKVECIVIALAESPPKPGFEHRATA